MKDVMTKAETYHAEADRIRAMALKVGDAKERDVMLAISEYYYLLHDKFVELSEAIAGRETVEA